MAGKYTVPKETTNEVLEWQQWIDKYLTGPMKQKEFVAPDATVKGTGADGKIESLPLCEAGICFGDFDVIHKETDVTAPLVSGKPKGFVRLVEGWNAMGGKTHALVNRQDIVIPLGHPTTEASRWMWYQMGSLWLKKGSKKITVYHNTPEFTTVALLSALQSIVYQLSLKVDGDDYSKHLEYWIHLLHAAWRFWKTIPDSRGPLDALWYDDRSRDTLQRAIACWIRPHVFENHEVGKTTDSGGSAGSLSASATAAMKEQVQDEQKLIMLETMLRRHWRVREGHKKAHNLWEELPLGLLTCSFLLPSTAYILSCPDFKTLQIELLKRMNEHYGKLQAIKLECKQAENSVQNGAMIQYFLQLISESIRPSSKDLVAFVHDCFQNANVTTTFHVKRWFSSAVELPWLLTKNIALRQKEVLPPRVRVFRSGVSKSLQEKDTKQKDRKDEKDVKVDTKHQGPMGGPALLADTEPDPDLKVIVEPSECGVWNGFIIPTHLSSFRMRWKATLCGGAKIKEGRTWGSNGYGAFRMTLSEFGENKPYHDILGRLEGVSSTGVKYDTTIRGWTKHPVLDISQPFQVEITDKQVLITRGPQFRDVWWQQTHNNRPLVVGFNYLVLEMETCAEQAPAPNKSLSPLALLL